MANIPYMQFAPHNSVNTAIQSYTAISEALRRQQESKRQAEMQKQLMPLQMQQLQNQLAVQQGQLEMQPYQLEEARLKNEMYPEMQAIENAYKQSQIERNAMLNKRPYSIGPGIAGQMQAYNDAIARGDTRTADNIMRGVENTLGSNITQERRNWNELSTDEQNQYVGKLKAFGYDSIEAAKMGAEGVPIGQAAQMKGLNPEQANVLAPETAPTTAVRTRNADRIGREAESEVLTNFVTPSIARYLGPDVDVLGFSTEQLGDALTGMNSDDQANLIAAYKIQMDAAANQLKLGAGIAGIEAIREQMAHSMTQLKPKLPHISPEVWSKAQYVANDILSQGARAYTEASSDYGAYINRKSLQKPMEEHIKKGNQKPLTELSDEEFMKQYNATFGGK